MSLEMGQWTNPESDDSFLQFRERSVRDGAWLSLAVILIVLVYRSKQRRAAAVTAA
jgi:hypothetical protein